ncbi:ribonuclease H-like domain-containing protein [Tanacetum coccineum]
MVLKLRISDTCFQKLIGAKVSSLFLSSMVTSVSSDDMLFDVHHNRFFFFLPLRLPKCDIEIGLKLIENNSDLFAMYDYARMYGILDMYVAHIPQKLEDLYFRNLCLDGSRDEVICDHFIRDSVEVEMHAPRVADKGKAKMLDDELVVKRRKANVKNKGIVIEENKNPPFINDTSKGFNKEVKHCKINIEDNKNHILTSLEIPHGLHKGRNFLESFGGHCNDPVLLLIKIPSMLHLERKFFESCGCLLLVCIDDIGSTQFSIYEMMNESSVWSVKYHVNIEQLMNPILEKWSIRTSVWCICLGEGEHDAFVVINLSCNIVKYNLISKTYTEIFDIRYNQMDDDDDDDDLELVVPPFLDDPNLYEFIPSLASAPRAWFQRFAAYAARVGFHHSRCDSSLFIYRQGADTAYLLLYVDDIVLTASSSDLLQQIITSLHAEFSMTDLGSLNYFLGISVTRNASGMFLSQQKYATEVLDRAGMLNCKPCRTPVDTDSKLSADGAPISDSTLYRSLAGALQYLTFTRPDISYAVQQVCLFMHDPREPHLSALKRILRYVRGTLSYGLQLYSSTTSSLVAYSDADWAGCPTTRRSTSGYCVFLGNNLLSWSSKRQFTLSRSSAEAEYRGVANAVAETCWLRNLLRELHTPLATATLVYCDNVSAVYLSSNPVQHQRTKHIEIDIHFVRDLVATGAIRVLHVPSRYQYADIFTKGLPTSLFDEFRTSLSVRSSPVQTAGEC